MKGAKNDFPNNNSRYDDLCLVSYNDKSKDVNRSLVLVYVFTRGPHLMCF